MIERLPFEVKFTPGDSGLVAGYASAFGRPADHVRDVVESGAFRASLASGPMPAMLVEHKGDPIGEWLEIVEDELGLRVKGRIDLTKQPGREAYDAVRAGKIDGLSIGYRAVKAARGEDGVRTLQEIALSEISLVRRPAASRARVLSIKSAPEGENKRNTKMSETEDNNADLIARLDALDAKVETRLKEVETKSADAAKIVERLDKVEAKVNRPAATEKKAETSEERKAFQNYLRLGDRALEVKTLTVSSDPGGGYIAPIEVSSEIIRDITLFSPIRGLASVRSTTSPAVSYPRRTAITNAAWRGEAQAATGSEPAFGQVEIPIKELSTFVDVSNQLLADSLPSAEAEVRIALAEDFARKEGLAFVSGDGILQPSGLLTDTNVVRKVTGNASTLGSSPADLLVDVLYSLPAAYRSRSTWLMNSTVLALIRKLKDSTGQYLWQPAIAAGQPETVLGRPVTEIPDMPDVAANALPIAFGDVASAFRIVDRMSMSVLVNPYLLATNGVTRIHATRRVGAAVVQPEALRFIKVAAS